MPKPLRVKAADVELLRQLAKSAGSTPSAFLSWMIRDTYATTVKKMKRKAGFGLPKVAAPGPGPKKAKKKSSTASPKRKASGAKSASASANKAATAKGKSRSSKKAPAKASAKKRKAPPLPPSRRPRHP